MRQLAIVGIAAALGLSIALSAQAFSVGDIQIQSRQGMPFVAEVPLKMKPHERGDGFVVVIGDEADYEAERLPRAPVIDHLRPTVIMGPPDVIRVASKQAIEATAFDLVLLVRTGQVTIVRNYPITLPAPLPTAIMASRPESKPKLAASSAASRPSNVIPPSAVAGRPASSWVPQLPARYGPVLPGESLYKIMKRLEIPSDLIWPMAVLTWKYNTKQFIRENIHGLRSGVYLKLPANSGTELASVDESAAQQMVAEQWETWRNPKAVSPPTPAVETVDAVAMYDGEGDPEGEMEPVPSQAVVMPSEPQPANISHAKLESVLTGLEQRLTQRFALPALTPDEPDDTTVTFVSATDLKDAIEGLEVRLTQHLEQAIQSGVKLDQVGALLSRPHVFTSPAPVGSQAGFSIGSWLGSNAVAAVIIVQNLLLVLLAVGFIWFWYQKRV